jgi:POT family proton-dependent oligopeptide transporter
MSQLAGAQGVPPEAALTIPHHLRREIMGHPAGVWIMASTEFWDRVSFHGMQAMLTLYMADELLRPDRVGGVAGFSTYRAMIERVTGPLSIEALAVEIFGLYSAFTYLTPIVGGWLGDRVLSRRWAVVLGGLAMTMGHFAMAFDATFLVALALLNVGAGLFRGNLSPQVRALYANGDPRAADAFQIYYMMINIGAFVAPLVTGALAAAYGWHVGFGFAGVGMALGLVVYVMGLSYLPPDPVRSGPKRVPAPPLTRAEWRRISAVLAIWPVNVAFWIAQTQIWNVYNLWVRDHVALKLGSFSVPIPWFTALDGISPLVWTPLLLALWARQRAAGTEADILTKLATGCLIFGGATMILAVGPWLGSGGRAPIGLPVAFHLLSNLGWCFVTPIMLAYHADAAPDRWRGTMLGINVLAVFVAQLITGNMGGFYESVSGFVFWTTTAAIVGGAGAMLLLVAPLLRRINRPEPIPISV